MREILFRGKTKDGEWVEGYYAYIGVNMRGGGMEFAHTILDASDRSPYGLRQYVVIPETVGQFTGLVDKNKKKVFEGDIVEITGGRAVVEYVEEYWFAYLFADLNTGECFHLYEFDDVEVIGNIHEANK